MEKKELNKLNPSNETIQLQLEEFIKGLGLKLFGFTHGQVVKNYQSYFNQRPEHFISPFETGQPEEKCNLSSYFISIAFPYAHDVTSKGQANFSVYVRGKDYHQVVQSYLDQICQFIEDLGYEAKGFVDSNQLPERLIAALAGVGFLGRNSTLITEEFGSYVFLSEIQTNLPLTVNQNFIRPGDYDKCGACQNCIKACPVSILGSDYVDTISCLSSLTQQKQLSSEQLRSLNGRLFGCDTCQMVCPFNRDKANRGLIDFKPFDYMSSPDLKELLNLSKSLFKNKYAITSAGWRGKALLSRNALAALASKDKLPEVLGSSSPMVQEAYIKLKTTAESDKL